MSAVATPTRRTAVIGGVQTAYYDEGTGEVPVVCLHGNPDTADQWLPLLRRAGELGRVVAPDLPGWGDSPAPDRAASDGSIDALAEWFDAFLDHVGAERVDLVVHDWGGLALSPASRRPAQIRRLVAIDVVPLNAHYKWHWISTYMWRPKLVGELTMPLFNRFTVKTLTRLQRPGFRAMDADWLKTVGAALDRDTKDSILRLYRSADRDVLARHGERLGDLTCPALIIWGELDPYVGIEQAGRVADALGGPVERFDVAGAGHWSMLDSPEVMERTAKFLLRP